MSTSKEPRARAAQKICLACGLCCNGTIFSDAKLTAGDDAATLSSLGLMLLKSRIKKTGATPTPSPTGRFRQPCSALNGCQCSIYSSRPGHCRAFECLLLKKVNEGRATPAQALRVIRVARSRAQKVLKLLRVLGDSDETIALPDRFRRTTRRLERAELDHETAGLYGQLTLAFYDLNMVIHEAFYARTETN